MPYPDDNRFEISIPPDLKFESVVSSCDQEGMVIEFNEQVVKDICTANSLPDSVFLENEIAFTNFLVAWYQDLKSLGVDIEPSIDLFFTKFVDGAGHIH